MQNLPRRGIALALALLVTASPLMAVTAEAGNGNGRGKGGDRGRGNSQWGSRDSWRGGRSDGYRGGNGGWNNSRPYYNSRPEYRTRRYVDRHVETRVYHHRDSGIGPFLGGLAVGAIIGSHANSCPPPRRHVVRRVYVYHCDCCDSYYRDYDGWIDHLVVAHHVPSCEVRDYYPEYDGGYWEEY